jgi:serine/threonine-protein kinase
MDAAEEAAVRMIELAPEDDPEAQGALAQVVRARAKRIRGPRGPQPSHAEAPDDAQQRASAEAAVARNEAEARRRADEADARQQQEAADAARRLEEARRREAESGRIRRQGADRAFAILGAELEMEFVRVPTGSFLMGSVKKADLLAYYDEFPQHSLDLTEFWIGRSPVTVVQFAAFTRATGYRSRANADMAGRARHPATNVTWHDAIAFCVWAEKAVGVAIRLPSEAEWEKAARGTDGRLYPWGNEPPDATRLNYDRNVQTTTEVGKYGARGASPYGCDDMAGNVWEWTRSLWGEDGVKPTYGYPYSNNLPERESLTAGPEVRRVRRGGSFNYDGSFVRCAFRFGFAPDSYYDYLGFRVVAALDAR